MVISPDGNFIIIASSERQLHVFRWDSVAGAWVGRSAAGLWSEDVAA